MKKLLFIVVAVVVSVFSANAQVKLDVPHPDLDVKITRCAFASGTVVIDMVITNFGIEETIYMSNGRIALYDDEGNPYDSRNSEMLLGFPNSGLLRTGDFTFPQDVPLKFRFQFSDISLNASKFALVKIGLISRGAMALDQDKPLTIRNLEWVK